MKVKGAASVVFGGSAICPQSAGLSELDFLLLMHKEDVRSINQGEADMTAKLENLADWPELGLRTGWKPVALAKVCGISLRQLERYFLVRFGQSPGQWLRANRMKLACSLVLQGESTKVVASELRFSCDAAFCRAFRKAFGTSSRGFRQGKLPMNNNDDY